MKTTERATNTSRSAGRTKASYPAWQMPGHEARLLRLQRTAGNAAVTSLIDASPSRHAADPATRLNVAPGSDQWVVARAPAAPSSTQEPNVKEMIAEAEAKADERTKLREDLKSFIVLSVEKFGRACANQKEEIRAEAAEDKELFSLILDIGFSFVPALLPLKGLAEEGFKKGAELAEKEAEKVVEASLKGVQRGIMKVRGSHESELEQFIDHLADLKDEAAVEAIEQADNMTEAQLKVTSGYYKNLVLNGDFEKEIKGKLDAFKRSARHVGEFRYWEFGASGQAEAVLINTGARYKLALVTVPSPITSDESLTLMKMGWNGGPVWLDWIPEDMVNLTKEKQFNEFGPFKFLQAGDYMIPGVYATRWMGGLSN